MHGSLNLDLLTSGDVAPNRFRRLLHRFGGDLQIGEQFQLLAAMLEGRLLPYDCLHATHPGEISVFSISSSTSVGNWPV